jgi:hypothetical protein
MLVILTLSLSKENSRIWSFTNIDPLQPIE